MRSLIRITWLGLLLLVGCAGSTGGNQNQPADGSSGPLDLSSHAPVDAALVPPDATVGGKDDLASAGPADLAVSNTTVIRVHYPAGGSTVSLRGSGGGLDWMRGTPMTATGGDTWSFTVANLAGTIEWKCLLDDKTWSLGPNYHAARGDVLDVYPHFTTGAGKVSVLLANFTSVKLPNTKRNIWVYLPPTYLENSRAVLPVVYMHDGQNLFDPKLAFGGNPWKADKAIDDAAASGRCDDGRVCMNDGDCGVGRCETFTEAIIIGIENTGDRIAEYTPVVDAMYGGGNGDAYLAMIVDELKPKVDAMLRTLPDRAHTTMIGSSLGGLISAHAGLTRGVVFGRIGAMSPSTWWANTWLLGAVPKAAAQPGFQRSLKLYVDSGDSGPSNDGITDTNKLIDAYVAAGYVQGAGPTSDLKHVVGMGDQHNEIAWAKRLPGALAFLLGPR